MNRRNSPNVHTWRVAPSKAGGGLAREWIRPAIRVIPDSITVLLPPCQIKLEPRLPEDAASRWVLSAASLEIAVAAAGVEPHDIVIEILTCAGQALWEVIAREMCARWLEVLLTEIEDLVAGEIDEQALFEKRKLLSSTISAKSRRRLADYARAAFAGTVAEYVHCLWHDVTIRTGSEYLPADHLRKRLELMERWFPPNRGDRLFPNA